MAKNNLGKYVRPGVYVKETDTTHVIALFCHNCFSIVGYHNPEFSRNLKNCNCGILTLGIEYKEIRNYKIDKILKK